MRPVVIQAKIRTTGSLYHVRFKTRLRTVFTRLFLLLIRKYFYVQIEPMAENNVAAAAPTSFIEAINRSYSHLLRTLIFFFLVFAFLVIAVIVFFKSIVESAELKAEFKGDGGLIFEVKKSKLFSADEKKTFATFLLPSNVVWFDTGLELESGGECKFKISGSAHLAIHTLVKKADNDEQNPIPWIDAKGNKWVNIGDHDKQLKAKQELLLSPGDRIGNILAYCVPENATQNFRDFFVQNRKELTTKIIQVDNEKIIQNTTGKKSRIYLSVNDILLNFDTAAFAISKEAYMGEDNKWENRWKEIATNKYDHLYFDDNIGSFLVQVEIRKSK